MMLQTITQLCQQLDLISYLSGEHREKVEENLECLKCLCEMALNPRDKKSYL